MSPIYQSIRDSKYTKIRDDGLNWSLLVGFLMIVIPFFLVVSIGGTAFILWLLVPFVIFGNLVGRMQQLSYLNSYNSEYENINNEYKKIIKNKKLMNKKEVDKIAKSLNSNNFSYSDILSILVYFEDIDNHKKQLKNKKIKITLDQQVNLKTGERLLFKTHTQWNQGSPNDNIFKDVGFLYLTNKRIIFLGKLRSYSTNFSRITHGEYGVDYFQVQKTAGPNDIYFIEPEESLQCLVQNYNSK